MPDRASNWTSAGTVWDAEADRGLFLVAYPDGLNRAWNTGGGCCGTPGRTDVDDIGFITAMVSAIERQIPVNANRVYATGISNGGIMAYTLACHTTIFAAIGPDSATELGSCPAPAPVSVIHIHGTADKNIPYQGGEGEGVAHIDGPAVPALNARWRGIDHCAALVTRTAGVVTTSTATCPAGRAVELITIAGAGHQWPGAVPNRLAQLLHTDPPSTALNATQVIWQFFAAHTRLSKRHTGVVRITVWVRPGSARPGVGGERSGALIVRVSARAVDGKATEAALAAVATAFGVRRRAVTLIAGAASRTKILEVHGADPDALGRLLADAAPGSPGPGS